MKRSSGITIIAVLVCLLSFIGCSFNDMDKNGFTFDSDYLYVDVDTFSLSDKSQNVSFSINCMSNWDITNYPEWLSISQLSGGGNVKIDIFVEANLEAAFREATLYVNLNAISKPVYIKQAPSDYVFDIIPVNFSFPKDTGEKPLRIHSNVSWSITHDQDWCHISEYSGNGDKILSIYCDNNNTNMDRYDTLRAKTSMETIKIPVKQSGSMYYITPTINFLHFYADGGVKSVPVDSNIEWTFKSIHNIATPKRTNNNDISVSLDRTTTAETRFDTIVVSDIPKTQGAEPIIKEYIYIEQEGLNPVLEIKPDSLKTKPLRFTNQGGEGTFTIESNLKWDLESSDESWCHIESPSGAITGNGEVKIKVDVNTTGASERYCTLSIKSSWFEDKKIVVHQAEGAPPYVRTPISSLTAKPQGEIVTFDIASNLSSWTVSSNQSWCKVQTASGSFNGTVSLSVELNSGSTARDATITIKSSISNVTVTVHQEPKEVPGGDDNPDPNYSRKR